MSFKGKLPTDTTRTQIRRMSSPYTVYRQTDSSETEQLGAPQSMDYAELSETRDLYLYGESERSSREAEGQVVTASLEGLALPSADIHERDRVDYGAHRYEVSTVTERSALTGDVEWLALRLERV